jgi:hypothetical protein
VLEGLKSLWWDANYGLDEIVIGAHVSIVAMTATAAVQVYHGLPLDLQGLGVGYAAVLGAMGGGMRARDGVPVQGDPPVMPPAGVGSTGFMP